MKLGIVGLLAIVTTFSVSGCGLSEASEAACATGRDQVTLVRGYVENGPPELIVTMAETAAPEFEGLAKEADDQDVKDAFAKLSKTFSEFSPDMSKRPTALGRSAEFDQYLTEFKSSVKTQADNLEAVCA